VPGDAQSKGGGQGPPLVFVLRAAARQAWAGCRPVGTTGYRAFPPLSPNTRRPPAVDGRFLVSTLPPLQSWSTLVIRITRDRLVWERRGWRASLVSFVRSKPPRAHPLLCSHSVILYSVILYCTLYHTILYCTALHCTTALMHLYMYGSYIYRASRTIFGLAGANVAHGGRPITVWARPHSQTCHGR
jgi:hypothetical protein